MSLWKTPTIKAMTAKSSPQIFGLLQWTICTDIINEDKVPVGSVSEIISKEKSPEKEARPSSIFLFSTGFGNWAQADNSGSDEISSDMDTSSDDDGSNADPLLSCSRDEDSESDVSSLTNVAISESFSATDLSQIDGECDWIEDCEEKEDAKILSPLSESRMSSSSGSPPWSFLIQSKQKLKKRIKNLHSNSNPVILL